jgi:hypothetical protein
VRELQDLIRLFLRDWDVRFGPKADIRWANAADGASNQTRFI